MKKHLIHIGYPKTGSTFLQEWFRQNPQICYSTGGLAGFHSIYQLVKSSVTSDKNEFSCYVTSSEVISTRQTESGEVPIRYGKGEVSPAYSIIDAQKNCCQLLKEIFPGAKILIVTRGLKKLLFSVFSQFAKVGGIANLNELFVSPTENNFAEMIGNVKDDFGINHLFEMYANAFGKENIIILPYELLRDDKRKFLSLIEKEMGLEPFDGQIPRLNESLSPVELYWYPRISKRVSRFAQIFGQKGYEKIYRWYVKRTLKNEFSWVVKTLNQIKPGQKVVESDFPEEILEHCRNFATILKDNPLYQPYLKEYLLD